MVIGILSAIVVTSYGGVMKRAGEVAIQSDLNVASSTLKKYFLDHGEYPASLNSNNCPVDTIGGIDTKYCLKINSGNTYVYLPSDVSNPIKYSLTESNSSGVVYNVTESTAPAAYAPKVFTGVLSFLSPATIAAVKTPDAVTVSPDGKSVYVANRSNALPTYTISMYSRNLSTGALTPLSTPTVQTQSYPYDLVVSPDGKSVYAINNGSNTISMFNRDTSTGMLTAMATPTIATGSSPWNIVISKDGKSIYVTNSVSNYISMYSRNTTDGTLTAIGTIPAGTIPYGIAISADGKSVYAVQYQLSGTACVFMYSRDTSTGILTAMATPSILVRSRPRSIAVSPDGKSVYVTNYTVGSISMFNRDTSTGNLTAMSTPELATSSSNLDGITVSPDNLSVYAVGLGANTVLSFDRDKDTGNLTASANPTIASGSGMDGIVVSPDNTSVYAVSYDDYTVWMYNRN